MGAMRFSLALVAPIQQAGSTARSPAEAPRLGLAPALPLSRGRDFKTGMPKAESRATAACRLCTPSLA